MPRKTKVTYKKVMATLKLLERAKVTEVDDTSDRLITLYKSESGLSKDAFLTSLFAEIQKLSDQITEAIKRDTGVSELLKADRVRNKSLSNLNRVLLGYSAMPIPTLKEPAEKLHKLYNKYCVKILRKNYADKSSMIESLLQAFSGEEPVNLAASLTGVKECVDDLKDSQTKFHTMRVTYEKAVAKQAQTENATALKKTLLDRINVKLVPYANTMKMVDEKKYKHFYDTIAQIITDTNAAIKLRSGKKVRKKKN